MFAYRNLRKASRKITMQTAQTFYRLIGGDFLAPLLRIKAALTSTSVILAA